MIQLLNTFLILHNSFRYAFSVYDRGSHNTGYSRDSGADQPIVTHLASTATALATFLAELAAGEDAPIPSYEADAGVIDKMLECYLVRSDCEMFTAAATP